MSIAFLTGAQPTVQEQITIPVQQSTSRIDMGALESAIDRMWTEAKAKREAREAAAVLAALKQTTTPFQQSTSNATSTALPSNLASGEI
jgi:hypothetical protein